MKIAVLSGKGGTGKTLLSVNLAAVAGKATYLDCDVEAPNGHLFFASEKNEEAEISVLVPSIDKEKCTGCRKCVDFCQFNAFAFIKKKPRLFVDVCHSCGGCTLVCPEGAISEVEKPIGKIQSGAWEEVTLHSGFLKLGEASGIPIIKGLLEKIPEEGITIIDCPPGSACIVMESIKEADYCLLVAEPTVFGAHNLQMVHELVSLFRKPYGVVLNKCIAGSNPSENWCKAQNIPIVGRIPFDPKLGKMSSNGVVVAKSDPQYDTLFSGILQEVANEAVVNS